MKFFLLLISTIGFQSHALETDQFIATNVVLKDSAPILNQYFEEQISSAIEKANSKNPEKIKCSEVASDVMDNLVGGKYFSISKISKFATKSPLIERFPEDTVSRSEYFKMTYYENANFMLKLAPFSRTINVNGIYMGTDKLGHFSLVGRNYYHNYLDLIEKGVSKEEAMKASIVKGFKSEKGMLGYLTDGVLSFGDLESNYEGLKFATDICDGEQPFVIVKDGKYVRNENAPFDMKLYFNPRMDESFHFNFWKPSLYKRIKGKLKSEYCTYKNDPMYIERISKYPPLVENLNDRLIKENILNISKFDRKLEDVQSLCN
jgi:hypothetical protein